VDSAECIALSLSLSLSASFPCVLLTSPLWLFQRNSLSICWQVAEARSRYSHERYSCRSLGFHPAWLCRTWTTASSSTSLPSIVFASGRTRVTGAIMLS